MNPEKHDEPQPDPITAIAEEVAYLRDLFQRRLLEDRQRERLYDQLYQQLELARVDLESQFVAPLLREVLLTVDRLEGDQAGAEATGDPGELLRSVRDELSETLRRWGVRRLDAPQGTVFDATLHEAVAMAAVESVEDDRVVIEQRRAGYLIGSRLLRPAQVTVGSFAATPTGDDAVAPATVRPP
jgi:molecular chaperone GrpE